MICFHCGNGIGAQVAERDYYGSAVRVHPRCGERMDRELVTARAVTDNTGAAITDHDDGVAPFYRAFRP